MTNLEACFTAPLTEELNDHYIHAAARLDSAHREAVELLREAFYKLTCFVSLQNYLLTPLYTDAIRAVDPYAPQLELWRRGATLSKV